MLLIPVAIVILKNPAGQLRKTSLRVVHVADTRNAPADILMLSLPFGIDTTGLFSYHPPLQTFAIILFAQGVLTLQPTSTKADKARGLAIHQIFQITGLAISERQLLDSIIYFQLIPFVRSVAAGVSIMIANKALHSGWSQRFFTSESCIRKLKVHASTAPHFTSWHGRFGLVTSILLVMQALIGILIAYDPGMRLLGGESKAKALWKYHRELAFEFSHFRQKTNADHVPTRPVGIPYPAAIAVHSCISYYIGRLDARPFYTRTEGANDSWSCIDCAGTMERSQVGSEFTTMRLQRSQANLLTSLHVNYDSLKKLGIKTA